MFFAVFVGAEESVQDADEAEATDEGFRPDEAVFAPEDEGQVVVPGFFMAAAFGAMEVVSVGDDAFFDAEPVAEEAGVGSDRDEDGGDEQDVPGFPPGGAAVETGESEAGGIAVLDEEAGEGPGDEGGGDIEDEGFLGGMLEADGGAAEDQPESIASERPAPPGGEGESDEEGEEHLHDIVAAVEDHHRRDGGEQHGDEGGATSEEGGEEQGDEDDGDAAEGGDVAEVGFGPGIGGAPAGEFGVEPGGLMEAGAVVVGGVVIEAFAGPEVGEFGGEDGLVGVHGAGVESDGAIVGAKTEGERQQEDEGGQ